MGIGPGAQPVAVREQGVGTAEGPRCPLPPQAEASANDPDLEPGPMADQRAKPWRGVQGTQSPPG
ncbi:hypothetical protein ACH3Y9_31485 [Streptomyces sp. WSLK1-5]|uniref:hypothetical protein n=1 Tax=unclassified Streptomyces TaxID=2593676 RepID=UPI0037B78AA8